MLPYGSIGKKQINEHSVNIVFINIFVFNQSAHFICRKDKRTKHKNQ